MCQVLIFLKKYLQIISFCVNAYRFQYYFFYFHRMHTRDADVSSGLTPSSNIRLLLTCLIKSTVKYVLIVHLFGIVKIHIFFL